MNMINIYIPQMLAPNTQIQGTINTLLTGLILACVTLIIIEAIPKWIKGTRVNNSASAEDSEIEVAEIQSDNPIPQSSRNKDL